MKAIRIGRNLIWLRFSRPCERCTNRIGTPLSKRRLARETMSPARSPGRGWLNGIWRPVPALAEKRRSSPRTRSTPGHIGFITTWNARCGIAEYYTLPDTNLSPERKFSVFANRISDAVREDEPNVSRCWTASSEDIPKGDRRDCPASLCGRLRAGFDPVQLRPAFSRNRGWAHSQVAQRREFRLW